MVEIVINKPDKIRVGGRKVVKLVSLEAVLLREYQKWYLQEYGENVETNGKQLDDGLTVSDVFTFLQDVIAKIPDFKKVIFSIENIMFDK